MMTKDYDAFIMFIKALREDGQGHVADKLQEPEGLGTAIHINMFTLRRSLAVTYCPILC